MSAREREPDYEERSQRFREEALGILDKECLNTVKKLLELQDSDDERISLDACKALTKLMGLEINQHEVSGRRSEPFAIIVERYDRKTTEKPARV